MRNRIILKCIGIFVTALSLAGGAAAAKDGQWFEHPFGELRMYHGDWLNVCQDSGAGDCRTVNYTIEGFDTFFGTSRLALHRYADGGYGIEIYDRRLPMDPAGPFALSVDGKALSAEGWSDVTPDGVRVAETVSLNDPPVTAPIVSAMRRGYWLTVTHDAGESVFSLRGLTKALNAIESHLERR